MKANIRSRNLALNAYLGILAITIIGGFATLFLIHVIQEVPFKTFAQANAYVLD